MIEELFKMYVRAKAEAAACYFDGDLPGCAKAAIFAFQCKKLAADLRGIPTVNFEF